MIYKENFNYSFDEKACEKCNAKCCTGESGYIFVSKDEMKAISSSLSLNLKDFKKLYTIKLGIKYSLKEAPCENGFACIFLDTDSKKCKIYDLRPKQCKTFPFWEYFKTHKKELEKECIGVCF